MHKQIKQALLGGIVATAVMTAVTLIGPMMGMPKMNPAEMLSSMMNVPVAIGWVMHFMVGIVFALSYAYIFIRVLTKVSNVILKGAIFGFIIFVFAQVMMMAMGAMMGGLPEVDGSKSMMVFGAIMGHVIYGIVVAMFVKERTV
ncbi:MAG: hypothetical protein HQ472_00315 [Ignavibacteria bacterium]|nr:hypothetical protein [Ignavibacteria bacterium]